MYILLVNNVNENSIIKKNKIFLDFEILNAG